MNEWFSTTAGKKSRANKKKLTHKVEEYTEVFAKIYEKIFGSTLERFREEKKIFEKLNILNNTKIEDGI